MTYGEAADLSAPPTTRPRVDRREPELERVSHGRMFGASQMGLGGPKRLIAFLVAILYGFLLEFDYQYYISPTFYYMGFHFYEHSPWVMFGDLVLLALPCLFLPMAIRRPSEFGVLFVYIIVYVPSILATSIATAAITPAAYAMKLAMLTSLALLQWVAGWRIPLRTPPPLLSPRVGMMIILALSVVTIGLLGLSYGFSIKLHALSSVYDQRDEFKAALEGAGYNTWLIGALTHAFAPMLLAYGLVRRSPFYIAISIVLQLYVFSITGLKSSLLTVVYLLVVYGAMGLARRSMLLAILCGTLLIVTVGIILSAAADLGLVNDLFVRRTFVIQGLLTSVYYDFMQPLDPLLWSHSILRPFFDAPVLADPEGAVGAAMFSARMHANAALWADAYMNGKFPGIFLAAAIVGLFLSFLDFCTARADLRAACCALAITFMMICQTGIIKVMGVHGGLLAGLLFLLVTIPPRGAGRSGLPGARAAAGPAAVA